MALRLPSTPQPNPLHREAHIPKIVHDVRDREIARYGRHERSEVGNDMEADARAVYDHGADGWRRAPDPSIVHVDDTSTPERPTSVRFGVPTRRVDSPALTTKPFLYDKPHPDPQ